MIDAFSEKPQQQTRYREKYVRLGLTPEEIVQLIDKDSDIIGISVMFTQSHNTSLEIISKIRKKWQQKKIVVGGSHANGTYKIFLENGADFAILGEGEEALTRLLKHLDNPDETEKIDGIAWRENGKIKINPKTKFIEELDSVPFPDFDAVKLKSYWNNQEGWGPTGGKYLPIISSRGCPFNCAFCASPVFWQRTWRYRSPKNVVDEIEHFTKRYGIKEFHFEDDNFTILKNRTINICKEIINRGLKLNFTTPNAIKADLVDKETLEYMKKAGFTFLNLAPDCGSERLLKLMDKKVDLDHLAEIAKYINELKIPCCAYFIKGFPGENEDDRKKTRKFIGRLARAGIDEVSIFTYMNFPGTKKGNEMLTNLESIDWDSIWTATGKGQTGKNKIRREIMKDYAHFYANQLIFHPTKFFRIFKNIIVKKQTTKTDRTVIRQIRLAKNIWKNKSNA